MAMTDINHLLSPAATTRFGKKKKTGVLYVGQHVLKPVHNCASGRREVDFYHTVFQQQCDDDHNDDISTLKHFLPRFWGVEDRAGVRHIKLENTLAVFHKPCMIDIKMGHVTSDPFAIPEKVAQRRSKYPYAERLGFTLSGMTMYLPEKDEFMKVDKYRCHNFNLSQVIEGFGRFFNFPANPKKDVIHCLLQKLQAIRRWFLRQRRYVFYASSLFIVYEGMARDGVPHKGSERFHCCQAVSRYQDHSTSRQPFSEQSDNIPSSSDNECAGSNTHYEASFGAVSCNSSTEPEQFGRSAFSDLSEHRLSDSTNCRSCEECGTWDCSMVDVRLIDFTHTFKMAQKDDNYISGLDSLISVLHILYSWC